MRTCSSIILLACVLCCAIGAGSAWAASHTNPAGNTETYVNRGDIGITDFINYGTVEASGNGGGYGIFFAGASTTFTNSGTVNASGDGALAGGIRFDGDYATFTNTGTVNATGSSGGYGIFFFGVDATFTNSGLLTLAGRGGLQLV